MSPHHAALPDDALRRRVLIDPLPPGGTMHLSEHENSVSLRRADSIGAGAPGDEGGGVKSRQLVFPEGLSEEALSAALRAIQDWEEDHGSGCELILALYPILVGDGSSVRPASEPDPQ